MWQKKYDLWILRAAGVFGFIVLLAFAYNSGKRDSDLWHERNRPTFDHALIIRPESAAGCHADLEKDEVVTVMWDGSVQVNGTKARVENCKFQWVVTQTGGAR